MGGASDSHVGSNLFCLEGYLLNLDLDPSQLAWFAAGATLIGAIVSIFRPDNTACPISLSPGARAMMVGALVVLQTGCQSIFTGTPWTQVLVTSLATLVAVLIRHGSTAGDAK